MSRAKSVSINREIIKTRLEEMGKTQRWLSDKIGLSNPQSLNNALSKGIISEILAYEIGYHIDRAPELLTGQLKEEGITHISKEYWPLYTWSYHLNKVAMGSLYQMAENMIRITGEDPANYTREEVEELRSVIILETWNMLQTFAQRKADKRLK